ncbi:hypothetical protein QFC22_002738 [Naganishia vaughanmartiniae]|uniref:Uncharacterized protein n=1 Tax=Naganishia vaughanmartiniae TaxID=1424756 RepID=A0ACC2X9V3_9TREE|nr:hypothetical protein QFC22_002738 [Naganishia vaughanmartiniae]
MVQSYSTDSTVKISMSALEEAEEMAGEEDLGTEVGVKNLGAAVRLALVRREEMKQGADPHQTPQRPVLLSHISHLSGFSTETTGGTSSEGNTFSVNSEESKLNSLLHPTTPGTTSSMPSNSTTSDHASEKTPSGPKDGKSSNAHSTSATVDPSSVPCPSTYSSSDGHMSLTSSDSKLPSEKVSIPWTPFATIDATEPSAELTKNGPSPVSDGSGTVFAGVEGDAGLSNIPTTEHRAEQTVGLLALPASKRMSNRKRPSDIQELRREDAIHDWNNDENKEKDGYQQVYEQRKEMKEQFRFRSSGVTPREVPAGPSFLTSSRSSYNRNKSPKAKERDWLPADDFDLLHEDLNPSEGRSRMAKLQRQDPHAASQSSHSNSSGEHARARFDAAIQAHRKSVQFHPRTIRPRNPSKAAEPGPSEVVLDEGLPSGSAPSQSRVPSSPSYSPRIGSQERNPGLSRRPSAKRAQSHVMSWDMALLSPAPQNDEVEENPFERANKALGSTMLSTMPSEGALDLNIIEQTFAAAITSTTESVPIQEVVVEGAIEAGPFNDIASHTRPTSPSAVTVSSATSAGSRRQFTSYGDPSLPEIQASTTHTELFYLAFGNGGSSSRQSLTGSTVQKKRERAENHKADRDLRAAEKLEREERRKQPYNNNFERPADDDTTTESQSESVTEGCGTSANDSAIPEHAETVTMSKDEGAAKPEERTRTPREARVKRRAQQSQSPEPIIFAAVIPPITGITILAKDGRVISNEPDWHPTNGQASAANKPVSEKSSGPPVHHGPKIQNVGDTLRPHGTFTTARHPTMTIHTDAIRARALVTDERFDTINTSQLQAAANAGDQIAEAHLHQRERRSRLVTSQEPIPADAMQAERPLRRRPASVEADSRRKSFAASPTASTPRKPASPVMQTIHEDGTANVA